MTYFRSQLWSEASSHSPFCLEALITTFSPCAYITRSGQVTCILPIPIPRVLLPYPLRFPPHLFKTTCCGTLLEFDCHWLPPGNLTANPSLKTAQTILPGYQRQACLWHLKLSLQKQKVLIRLSLVEQAPVDENTVTASPGLGLRRDRKRVWGR